MDEKFCSRSCFVVHWIWAAVAASSVHWREAQSTFRVEFRGLAVFADGDILRMSLQSKLAGTSLADLSKSFPQERHKSRKLTTVRTPPLRTHVSNYTSPIPRNPTAE
jgi:hypothetical protein